MNKELLPEVLRQFRLPEDVKSYGNGHINDTYLIDSHQCILQRINTSVFTEPDRLMENIEKVTEYLRKLILAEGGDPERGTLTILPTMDGKNLYRADEQNVFRAYQYIADTKTIEDDKTIEDLYEAGVGFGHFQKLLVDFPVEKLHETIHDFHHTPKRMEALKEAIQKNVAGRVELVTEEIRFAMENESWTDTVTKGIENGMIPVRVTHNDTKINNILFDKNTGKAVCVIDLDTVMPGSLLYDFGDALRMGGSVAAEDEWNLEQVWFDEAAFEAFTRGYLSEMKDYLTETELELLPFSVKLMTFECGIRFLTDYLNGDTYFKIHREGHNLDRARNQFKLVTDIAGKESQLKEIIKTCAWTGIR